MAHDGTAVGAVEHHFRIGGGANPRSAARRHGNVGGGDARRCLGRSERGHSTVPEARRSNRIGLRGGEGPPIARIVALPFDR